MHYQKRACVLYSAVLLCLLALCVKLYFLSCVDNRAMTVLDGQYSGKLNICQRSGFIYDRYFCLLSHDKCTDILVVNPSECNNIYEISQEAAKITSVMRQSEILEKIHEGVPFTLSVRNDEQAQKLCESYDGLYYCNSYEENTRTAQHLLGYSRDNEGITGIRASFNELLYHTLYAINYATFTDNAANQSMSPLTIHSEAYDSRDGIVTTIDKELQQFCDRLEGKVKSGCIIVADSTSGEILALSSFPSYSIAKLPEYLSSDKGELLNRTVYSYTPGSVFKIIVSAAALESSADYYSFTHNCTGSIQVDNYTFNCHKQSGHGEISMEQAFAQSCNCYYVALARDIGIEEIISTAKKLELDMPIKADFLAETEHRFIDEGNDSEGYLANIAIGQGDLCLSPLDMINVMMCATTGKTQKLSVVLGEVQNGEIIYKNENTEKSVFSEETVCLLCKMMEECVNTGTGRAAKIEDVRMGGKTATAQTGRYYGKGVEYVHKWFCGFYEGIEKRYIFAVLCDNTPENFLSPADVSGDLCRFFKENMY
ncbi:MAG: hypothetical protein J6K12_00370 [Clostridia bacterium]|nr:hypothetical protein [Clostridia bacterium]